ncbi:MAG TPA: hypothetical protein VM942_03870, partial [Acidimicrobiales bacterium]|nr:hypothetical protein [Acidimicrobiales bacterium]
MDDQGDERPGGRSDDPMGGSFGAGTDDDEFGTDPGPAWSGVGASRGPRSPAEGVRIIGAEEAAAALEAGHVSPRVPDDAPRFGDVPQPPSEPRPGIRFPGVDPRTVAKPPVVTPPFEAKPQRSVWDAPAEQTLSTSRAGRFEELIARADERAAERGIDVQSVLAGGTRAGGGPGGGRSPMGGGGADLGGSSSGGSYSGGARSGGAQSGGAQSAGDWPPPLPPSAAYGGPGGGDDWPPEPGSSSDDSWPPPPPSGGGDIDDGWPPPPPAYAPSRGADDAWPPPPPAPGQPPASGAGADFWPPDEGSDIGFEADPLGPSPWDTFDEPVPSAAFPRASVPSMPAGENSGSIPLPHWTEPATGEVPVILADQPPPPAPPPDELGSWSNLSSGPRWRDQAADWDEADFDEAIL